MENTYKVEIIDSSKELTAREKIALKDTAECISLDQASKENPYLEIPVDGYVILKIHNERAKSGDPDYEQLIILSGDERYITGSGSFRSSFVDIYADMEGDPNPWSIRVVRRPSKNYGGEFLKATLVV